MNLKLTEGQIILKELVLESSLDGFVRLKQESLKVGNLIIKDLARHEGQMRKGPKSTKYFTNE